MMRRGKLVWESASLNVICDRCNRPRNHGNHSKCSEDRKTARQRETVAAVKYEILQYLQQEDQ